MLVSESIIWPVVVMAKLPPVMVIRGSGSSAVSVVSASSSMSHLALMAFPTVLMVT